MYLYTSSGTTASTPTWEGTLTMPQYIAQKFVASTPKQEVIGQLAMSNFQNILHSEIDPLLEKHDLVGLKPDQWYSHQNVLNLYRDIESGKTNVTDNLVAIGTKGVDNVVLPPEMQSLDAILSAQTIMYQLNLRPIAEGEGLFPVKISDNHYQIRMNAPYPVDLMYGFYWALINRFRPQGASFKVQVVDNPHPDTEPGTIYDITWTQAN